MDRPHLSLALSLVLSVCAGPFLSGCTTTVEPQSGEPLNTTLARGDTEFEARNYPKALETYRLAAYVASSAQEEALFVEAAAQAASVLALLGQVDEATAWLARASERADDDEPRGWSRVLLARGLKAWKEERREDAHVTFAELFEYCVGHDETVRALQAAQMASVVSEDSQQIEWARRAIELAAKAGKPTWEAPLWANLGWLLDTRGMHEDALQAFERALVLTRQGEPTRIVRARSEWAYAHALLRAGRLDEAQRGLDELEGVLSGLFARQRAPEVAEYLGRTLRDLGELDVLAGQPQRARERFVLARTRFVEAGALEAAPQLLNELDARIESLDARAAAR
jgi:tetratricopeptide (TPR) repeat protein